MTTDRVAFTTHSTTIGGEHANAGALYVADKVVGPALLVMVDRRGASFDALTAISAIEHGYDGETLFAECARLLRPGGHLILSFDYWPEKIDTAGTLMYGMTWRIFSRAEAVEMMETAGRHGLEPIEHVDLDAGERVVRWGRWQYTFAWLALRKATR